MRGKLDAVDLSDNVLSRLDQVEVDVEELTDLEAHKSTQVEDVYFGRIADVEVTVANMKDELDRCVARAETAIAESAEERLSSLQDRFIVLEDKLGEDLDQRMLGVLRASITPLAEYMTQRLALMEASLKGSPHTCLIEDDND